LINGTAKFEATARAGDLLDRVGLSPRASHRPGELSGGERQRVALARALIAKPTLLLADEPTGNLDEQTGEAVHSLIRQLHIEEQLTAIIVTHNQRLASICDRRLRLENGKLSEL
ncbi:MAG: ABC transporter ATP-binding protein, partial [Blastocatellia bacterium]